MNKSNANLVAGLVVNALVLVLAGIALVGTFFFNSFLSSHLIHLPLVAFAPIYVGFFLMLFFLFGGKDI